MLTPEDIDALQKLVAYFMGCFTGLCFGWTLCEKSKPPPPVDVPEEVMQRGGRIVNASIAMERNLGRTPKVTH